MAFGAFKGVGDGGTGACLRRCAVMCRRRALVVACLVVAGIGPTATIHPAAAAFDWCGMTVVDDVKLEDDVTCAGDGLIVGADNITIDLNGHTIAGSGVGAGMIVTGRTDVSIKGGTISNFAVAVRLNTSTDVVIKDSAFVGNGEGIDMQAGSIGNTIKNNAFRNQSIRGIMLRGNVRDNDIKDNRLAGNRVGILVFAGADNTLKNNVVSESTVAAVRFNVFATGNLVKDNLVMSSTTGIEFLVTPTGSATGNELKDNTISANACGLKGPTDGNDLKDNLFEGNVADTCV